MTITFNGIGSGLDIDAIVGAIVDAERAPTEGRLNRLESNVTEELSAVGQLNSALTAFLDAVDDLSDESLFRGRSVSIGDRSLISATADESAQAGSYQIQIEQIATAQKIATQAVATAGTEVGTGTLNIYLGSESFSIDIDENNNTLQQIRTAINESENNLGVTASIINDETGARLVLTSNETGLDNTISLTVNDNDGDNRDASVGLSQLVYDPTDIETTGDGGVVQDGRELDSAQNAIAYIDGLRITGSNNTFENAIEGVTFNLLDAQDADDFASGDTINLTVGNDTASARGAIENFVNVYNSFLDVVEQLTVVVVNDGNTGNVTGALTGDSTVRGLLSNIRSQFSTGVSDNPQGLQFLVNIGVSTDQEGRLTIDNTRLNNAFSTDFDAIANLFSGDNGLSNRLSESLDGYTGSSGILQLRRDSLQNTLNGIDDQREALERRIELTQERLFAQYRATDALVGQLNNTLSFLTSSLQNTPINNRRDN